jgi:hypothetical protein
MQREDVIWGLFAACLAILAIAYWKARGNRASRHLRRTTNPDEAWWIHIKPE